MEEYVFIFSKSRLTLQFSPQTTVSAMQISSVKDALVKHIPKEQSLTPQQVASIRLFHSGKELGDKDTLQRVQALPNMPRNLHVHLTQVSDSTSLRREMDDPGLAKHSQRLCCSDCVIW